MCMLLHYCVYMATATQKRLTLADLEAARDRDAEEQSEEEWELEQRKQEHWEMWVADHADDGELW